MIYIFTSVVWNSLAHLHMSIPLLVNLKVLPIKVNFREMVNHFMVDIKGQLALAATVGGKIWCPHNTWSGSGDDK